MKAQTRFEKFRQAMLRETGDKAIETKDGQVMIARNEFSPDLWFASLQQAIDHYARFMPAELTEERR